jgi:hypothetical protein
MDPQLSPGRVQILLQRTPEEAFEPDSVAEAALVRFVAYDHRHRMAGWVRLDAERLTDLLNDHDEIVLTDLELERLEDGRARSVEEVVVRRDDLVAVHASGPRGGAALWRRTRTHPVALQAGRFLIGGHLHAAPGADPLAELPGRAAMVPLTDAWIEYWSGAERTKHSVGTIIVNRRQADWIRLVTDEDLLEGLLRPTPGERAATT